MNIAFGILLAVLILVPLYQKLTKNKPYKIVFSEDRISNSKKVYSIFNEYTLDGFSFFIEIDRLSDYPDNILFIVKWLEENVKLFKIMITKDNDNVVIIQNQEDITTRSTDEIVKYNFGTLVLSQYEISEIINSNITKCNLIFEENGIRKTVYVELGDKEKQTIRNVYNYK